MSTPFNGSLFREGALNMEVFCFDYQRLQIEDICAGLMERSDGRLNCLLYEDSKTAPKSDIRSYLVEHLVVSYPYYALYDEKQSLVRQGPLIYDVPDIIALFEADNKKK